MTSNGIVVLVSKLYAAAGRTPGEVDFATYDEALAGLDDATGQEAVRDLVRVPNLRPSPGGVLEAARAIQRRAAGNRQAFQPPPRPATEVGLAGVASARAALVRVPVLSPPPAARLLVSAHDFGQHELCGPDCVERG